eukprot:4706982-Alexandrium_andersonii.AAC.1
MTASTKAGSTGKSCPGWSAGPASTASISGDEGTDCELTGALEPCPCAGTAKQEAGGCGPPAALTDCAPAS